MKQKERIPCSELLRLLACGGGLCQPSILKESPRQRIPRIYVVPDFELFPGELEGLGQLHIVIGIKKRKIAIVKYLIDAPKHSNVFDQSVLVLRLFLIARPCIEVAKLGNEGGHRHDGNCLSIEHNRLS